MREEPVSEARILSSIWNDPDFVALSGEAQRVYMLLLSHSSRNWAGVIPLTIKRWVRLSANATEEVIRAALTELAANNFIVVDWDTEEVLIRTFIRNDKVFKQPQVMKAALRQAADTASPTLKSALSDELLRLPNHTGVQQTREVAFALVESLPAAFGQPSGSLRAASGVGDYVSGVRESPSPTPSPTPAPAPTPANVAGQLVREVIPREQPDAVKTLLRVKVGENLHRGVEPHVLRTALERWLVTDVGAGAFDHVLSDVLKSQSSGRKLSTVDEKVIGWAMMGRERDAQRH